MKIVFPTRLGEKMTRKILNLLQKKYYYLVGNQPHFCIMESQLILLHQTGLMTFFTRMLHWVGAEFFVIGYRLRPTLFVKYLVFSCVTIHDSPRLTILLMSPVELRPIEQPRGRKRRRKQLFDESIGLRGLMTVMTYSGKRNIALLFLWMFGS